MKKTLTDATRIVRIINTRRVFFCSVFNFDLCGKPKVFLIFGVFKLVIQDIIFIMVLFF